MAAGDDYMVEYKDVDKIIKTLERNDKDEIKALVALKQTLEESVSRTVEARYTGEVKKIKIEAIGVVTELFRDKVLTEFQYRLILQAIYL